VKTKKNILIITDNSAIIRSIAENIKSVFGGAMFVNWSPTVISAEDFIATKLLPAHAFLIGCEKPEPPDFTNVRELFKHINLAGRPCGIFSSQANSIKYLSGLVRDSEAALGSPIIINNTAADSRKLKKWVGSIIGDKV
jgi:hypothetical protein